MSKLRAYILCRFAEQSSVYKSWLDRLPQEYEVVTDYAPDWPVPSDAGILISHMHYRWEEVSALRRATETDRVPVLILADGILEYRNTWEHPDLPDGSIFQPVCGHKLACIGRAQARVVEAWGNPGKCEVVGLPRLDAMTSCQKASVRRDGPLRLLIATARTPAFNERQRQAVVDSLRCLLERFERNPEVAGRHVEVTWRLTDGLAADIGVSSDSSAEQPSLAEAIGQADAVITSPSTLYLESIACRRPTAVLDFWNSPSYVPSAWSIAAPAHVNRVLEELAAPPAHKMMYQQSTLLDQLECQTPAAARMLRLIETMLDAGIQARENNRPIELPPRILPNTSYGFSRVPDNFDLATLYPDNDAFQTLEVQRLQVELSLAVRRLEHLPLELSEKDEQIALLQTTLADTLNREAKLLGRVRELHARMTELRQHYGLDAAPRDEEQA